jgi:hypothetical protein
MATSAIGPPTASPESPYANASLIRYRDAYRVARTVNGLGTAIKVVGWILGIGVVASAFLIFGKANNFEQTMAAAAACGACIVFLFFLVGVFIAALAQTLKATLDAAVDLSPFMTDNQKGEVIFGRAASRW